MPYAANIYRVFVASPGDVAAERDEIRRVIREWNTLHATSRGVQLEVVRWEEYSIPDMSERPQAVINRQVLDDCDLLIGVFWTRLGTPTGIADSGTQEEIQRFLDTKKPVMLYFSERPIRPNDVDFEQYGRLKEYRSRCEKHGLVRSYAEVAEFGRMLRDQLTLWLHSLPRNVVVAEDKAIYRTFSMWVGKLADEFILQERELSILLRDGHTFFRTKGELMRKRLMDKERTTRFLLLHPEYEFIDAVADMDPLKKGQPGVQKRDCMRAVEALQKLRHRIRSDEGMDIGSRVSVRGYKCIPTWMGQIGTSKAVVHLFSTMPRQSDMLTLEIPAKTDDGGYSELYQRYKSEFEEIDRMTEGDPKSDLWSYEPPAGCGA
jgi:hypothetical protein